MVKKKGPANAPKQSPRPGSQRVELSAEGTNVYLYDEGRTVALRKERASEVVLGGSGAAWEKKLAKITRDRSLVVYELPSDDGVRLDVMVGPPLSAKELKEGKWLAPQITRLALPTGKLC